MIDVEYKEQLERAINGRTAVVYFLVTDKHFGTYRDQPDARGGKVSPWTRRKRWWHSSGSDSQGVTVEYSSVEESSFFNRTFDAVAAWV